MTGFFSRRSASVFLAAFLALAVLVPCAGAAEPEQGLNALVLTTPGTVNDGEAFLCTASAAGATRFTFEFRGKKVTVEAIPPMPGGGSDIWPKAEILLSIPLDSKEKSEKIVCTALGPDGVTRKTEAIVTITPKQYPVQELTVEPKYVAPPASETARIERERAASGKALGTISPVRYWTLPLLRPVPGIVTSEYGVRRVFNNVPKAPHRGVDFRGAEGAPILAAARGKVVLAGDYYYAGKNVIIDHGLGTLTHYMHLSEMKVAEGQMVERGELVGLVGSTGRVTGPHLHLGLTVLGSSINVLPMLEAAPEAPAHTDPGQAAPQTAPAQATSVSSSTEGQTGGAKQ